MTNPLQWLHKNRATGLGTAEEMPPLPVTAELPKPPSFYNPGNEPVPDYSQADRDRDILGKAAVIHDQLMRDRADAEQKITDLQIQLDEALLSRQVDGKKTEMLEKENSQLRDTIAKLQSEVNDYRTFMSLQKKALDAWGIKAPEKKPRVKKSIADAGSASPAASGS